MYTDFFILTLVNNFLYKSPPTKATVLFFDTIADDINLVRIFETRRHGSGGIM